MNIETKARLLLDKWDFDFSQFTMSDFVGWIERRKDRKIIFIEWEMPPGMFGAWLSDADEPVEYIFIEKSVPSMHQTHIQLHELSHILLEHTTIQLSKNKMKTLLHQAINKPDMLDNALLRASANHEMEEEAETLAALIQYQVIQHEKLQQLMVSSQEGIGDYFDSLGIE